jgi:HlyD family secretion protein
VWKIEEKGKLRAIPVTLGVTDGTHTELLSGDLKPGDEVATGQNAGADTARTPSRNPMMPLGGRGGRR